MDLLAVVKWLLPSAVTAGGRRLNDDRERRILDLLEHSGQPLSVDIIHNEFIEHIRRDVKLIHVTPTLRPGGDPSNEANHIPPRPPIHVRLRHLWRVNVKREIPTEQKVRDILRNMKERGIVDFVGNDSWMLRRK
jgi:hypothetical protein